MNYTTISISNLKQIHTVHVKWYLNFLIIHIVVKRKQYYRPAIYLKSQCCIIRPILLEYNILTQSNAI